VKLNHQKTELRVLAHEVHHLMAGLRLCRCLLALRHKPPPWHALPSLRLMQRMSPMIRDVSRYPDPRCLVLRLRSALLFWIIKIAATTERIIPETPI
jgi:hypothetical protein